MKLEGRIENKKARSRRAGLRLASFDSVRWLCVALFISFAVALADQPSRPLTRQETKTVERQITLGRRILAALAEYSKAAHEVTGESASMWSRGMTELGLLTRSPTIDVLHAAGYLTDSDHALARHYHAMPQHVPANATTAQPLLTMHSELGELVFDSRGAVTVRCEGNQ